MRSRANIVRDIHKIYTHGDSLGALRFGGNLPSTGDMVIIHLAMRECRKYNVGGLQLFSILLGAADLEKLVGFISYDAFSSIYGKQDSSNSIKLLFRKGLLERVPFPDTFSHIKRRVKCYKVSDKGHHCIRAFKDTFALYQREVRRAKVSSMEGL